MSKGLEQKAEFEAKENLQYSSLAEIYFNQAEKLRINNQYKKAADKYLHSILLNKSNPAPYLGLALSYKSLKNYTKAVITLEKVEKMIPLDMPHQKELLACYISNGDYEKGIKRLISLIKLEPDNIELQMQLALLHEILNEEEMALMIYQKIIETKPSYLRAYIQKATLYMYLEDYLSSAKVFRTIIKIAPKYYRAYLAIGICYEKLGNVSAAKRFYSQYLKFPKSHNNLSDVTKRLAELKIYHKNNNHLKLV